VQRRAEAILWLKKSVRANLPRGQFARGVAMLAGGTALGQAITVLASPILTRLYTPEDFGVLAVYASILNILLVIASWRYELAIPLPEKDEEAVNLVVLSLGIVALMSLIVGLGFWFPGAQISDWVNTPALQSYLWLLPVGVLLAGSYQVFNYWAVRRQAFGSIARTKLHQGIGSASIQIGLGLVKPLPLGLMFGQVAGQTAGLFTLVGMFWKQSEGLLKTTNVGALLRISKRYCRFPLYSSWSGVLNTLSVQIPVLILSSLFSSTVTGFYLLAYRVLWIPSQLVSQATGQVLLSVGSEAHRRGDVSTLVTSVFRKLVLIGLPCFGLIGLIAPEMTAFIFGENWQETGILMQWLMPWIFLAFVTSPLSTFSIVLEKQRQEALFQSVLLTSRISALLVGWVLGSSRIAIGLFSVVSVICWLGYLGWILNLTCVVPTWKVAANTVLKEAGINLPFFLPLVCVKILVHNIVWLLMASSVTALLLAALVLHRLQKGEGNG
jgi:O-antigen/teichoic acid export membrane protein